MNPSLAPPSSQEQPRIFRLHFKVFFPQLCLVHLCVATHSTLFDTILKCPLFSSLLGTG